jgi:hypothetical protein
MIPSGTGTNNENITMKTLSQSIKQEFGCEQNQSIIAPTRKHFIQDARPAFISSNEWSVMMFCSPIRFVPF